MLRRLCHARPGGIRCCYRRKSKRQEGARRQRLGLHAQAVTFACALNDVGSWSLIAWQATFYERVYELGSETYAPLLAVIIPVCCVVLHPQPKPCSAAVLTAMSSSGPDSTLPGPSVDIVTQVGGIIGGVGGGLCGDWLSRIGGRQWLTAGARRLQHTDVCCLTAPCRGWPVRRLPLVLFLARTHGLSCSSDHYQVAQKPSVRAW